MTGNNKKKPKATGRDLSIVDGVLSCPHCNYVAMWPKRVVAEAMCRRVVIDFWCDGCGEIIPLIIKQISNPRETRRYFPLTHSTLIDWGTGRFVTTIEEEREPIDHYTARREQLAGMKRTERVAEISRLGVQVPIHAAKWTLS